MAESPVLSVTIALLNSIQADIDRIDTQRNELNVKDTSESLKTLAEAYALVVEHSNRANSGNTVTNGYRNS